MPNTPAAGNNNRPTMLNFDTPQSADSTNKHNNGGIMVEPPSPLSNKPPQQNTPTSSTSITTTSALSNTSKTAQSAERKTAMTAPSKNKKIKLNKSVVIQTKSLVNYDVSSTSEDESDNRGDNKTPPTPELTPFVARF